MRFLSICLQRLPSRDPATRGTVKFVKQDTSVLLDFCYLINTVMQIPVEHRVTSHPQPSNAEPFYCSGEPGHASFSARCPSKFHILWTFSKSISPVWCHSTEATPVLRCGGGPSCASSPSCSLTSALVSCARVNQTRGGGGLMRTTGEPHFHVCAQVSGRILGRHLLNLNIKHNSAASL